MDDISILALRSAGDNTTLFSHGTSSHVMPTQTGAMAGIYGCVLQGSALLNIKPDIASRGMIGSSIPASAEAEKKASKAETESARKVKTHISTFFDPYLNQKHYGVQEREVWDKWAATSVFP